jgi:hypothetical protein
MSLIWQTYNLANNNKEFVKGSLDYFYFHSPSIQQNIFTYPEGGGRTFWSLRIKRKYSYEQGIRSWRNFSKANTV